MFTSPRETCVRKRTWFWIGLAVWLAAVLCFWGRLSSHSFTPGSLLRPPALHPIDNPFGSIGQSHLLVMALHPKCPCSRASLGELEKIQSSFPDKLNCVVLNYQPEGAPEDWATSGAGASARRLPFARIVVDSGGELSRSLGMTVSGSTVLYSPQGDPRYWGGITASRGHGGDNLGANAIAAILRGRQTLTASHPAYGCQIIPIANFGAD